MPLTLAVATALGLGLALANSTRAGDFPFSHTLPGEVPAYDFTTGGPYMAPPIPYGHYAKDPVGDAQKFLACPTCKLKALFGGGTGGGLLHHGAADGIGDGGDGMGGHGFFGHGHDGGSGGHAFSGLTHHGNAGSPIVGTAVVGGPYAGAAVLPTGQFAPMASGQSICGQPGCGVNTKHSHLGQNGCGSCGGSGCGSCGGSGLAGLHGGSGHNMGCGLCGGKGCSSCLAGLGSGLHGKLASMTGAFHKPKLKWFVGPGGPVPMTPGYVPYVVSTRSPRDFFSFAPMNPNDP